MNFFSFMDAYSEYNQIKMHSEDEDKTAFTIGRAIYCYGVMPFGLRNARATFQRMVDEISKSYEITMDVYVDDMLVKSLNHTNYLKHLEEVFALL